MSLQLNLTFKDRCEQIYGPEMEAFNTAMRKKNKLSTDSILLCPIPANGGLSPLFDIIKKTVL